MRSNKSYVDNLNNLEKFLTFKYYNRWWKPLRIDYRRCMTMGFAWRKERHKSQFDLSDQTLDTTRRHYQYFLGYIFSWEGEYREQLILRIGPFTNNNNILIIYSNSWLISDHMTSHAPYIVAFKLYRFFFLWITPFTIKKTCTIDEEPKFK